MMVMHVPQTLAISKPETASTEQSSALMQTDVPLRSVTHKRDALQLQRTAMTATHVPLTHVTHKPVASTLQRMLMTRTHVPEIGVMQRLEKSNTKQSHAMTTTHVPLNLAILSSDACLPLLT
jgi:hypothetical protein